MRRTIHAALSTTESGSAPALAQQPAEDAKALHRLLIAQPLNGIDRFVVTPIRIRECEAAVADLSLGTSIKEVRL
jgi:hypothetical protein